MLFHFLALASYVRSKTKIPFLCLSFLWNQMDMLATQATQGQTPRLQDVGWKVRWNRIVQDQLWGPSVPFFLETKRKLHGVNFLKDFCSLNASSWGALDEGREKEGELATTSLEFEFHLQFPVAPCRLSFQISANQREAETSANVNKHWKTRAKGNDVITNVISANQHFASTFSMQIFKFQRRSCKLSFLSLPAARPTRRACSQAKTSGSVNTRSDREKIGQ